MTQRFNSCWRLYNPIVKMLWMTYKDHMYCARLSLMSAWSCRYNSASHVHRLILKTKGQLWQICNKSFRKNLLIEEKKMKKYLSISFKVICYTLYIHSKLVDSNERDKIIKEHQEDPSLLLKRLLAKIDKIWFHTCSFALEEIINYWIVSEKCIERRIRKTRSKWSKWQLRNSVSCLLLY